MGMNMDMGSALSLGLGALGGLALASRQKTPSLPAMPAPDPVPQSQAAKAPDANTTLQTTQGTGATGGSPGIAQTFLTGGGGVDPRTLKTVKPQLLG